MLHSADQATTGFRARLVTWREFEPNTALKFWRRDNTVCARCGQCAICHSAGGINSLESRSRLLKPNALQQDFPGKAYGPRWWEYDQTINWKRHRDDWRLLNGYWRTGSVLH